jgi:hypothetical protein
MTHKHLSSEKLDEFRYNDLSDLGDGFAQEVNSSILRQHLQQAQAKAEAEGDGHLEPLLVFNPTPYTRKMTFLIGAARRRGFIWVLLDPKDI